MKTIEYPSLERSARLYPTPRILLGKLIWWTEKRDGSNCGAFLRTDEIYFRSRHQLIAADDIRASIKDTGYVPILHECLLDAQRNWNDELVIFFELLQKGKSPTHTEFHPINDIRVFDIYSAKEGWLNYNKVYQIWYQWKLPIVELWAMSRHLDEQSFAKFRLRMLRHAKKAGREGVVGKVYGDAPIFFKERLDIPSLKKSRTHIENGALRLPPLPPGEIRGAVHKAYIDLGLEQFSDKRIAMPIVARYINEEAKKHLCSAPKSLFQYYLDKLEDLK